MNFNEKSCYLGMEPNLLSVLSNTIWNTLDKACGLVLTVLQIVLVIRKGANPIWARIWQLVNLGQHLQINNFAELNLQSSFGFLVFFAHFLLARIDTTGKVFENAWLASLKESVKA